MSTPYEYDADRALFGGVLKKWFKRNDWPQSITEHWAKGVGSQGPWSSQVSNAFNGRLDPKAQFFIAWGNFNRCVAERDFRGVTDRRVMDLLKDSQPLCHDNGEPLDASDFFKLFTGLAEPPHEYAGATIETTFSDEGALAHGENVARCFKAWARDQMLIPREAWDCFKNAKATQRMKPQQLSHVQDIMRGAEVLTGEAMTECVKDWEGECLPLESMVEIAGDEGKKVREILEKTFEAAGA